VLGIAADRALFIDDSAKNIAGAVQAGLVTHLFTDAAALAEALHHHQALPRL
jgi:2-haloacid dehalogenase